MISISKELALELLMQRVKFWSNDINKIRRWREYLEEYFLEVFVGELNPEYIVDNLWVNDTEFIEKTNNNENLEIGEELNTDDFYGTIEYIGSDFIVICLR